MGIPKLFGKFPKFFGKFPTFFGKTERGGLLENEDDSFYEFWIYHSHDINLSTYRIFIATGYPASVGEAESCTPPVPKFPLNLPSQIMWEIWENLGTGGV